ncbi:hypothetical protein LEP1GSC198_0128 [Leptospira kirschneri str. JB]|nr:hypothetical protein LEP1GSC198_0128 [Leptospira kirschneri str. JB]
MRQILTATTQSIEKVKIRNSLTENDYLILKNLLNKKTKLFSKKI